MTRLVSVIVPTRNTGPTIDLCLASIRAQEGVELELVVVDNHSTDDTAARARPHADVVLVAGPERSAQRNLGARTAAGDVLVFIDADMVLDPGLLAEVLDRFTADPTVGMVVLTELARAEGFFGRARVLEKELYVGDAATEAARAFTRDAFEEAGGFDEDRNAFEDWDLSDRVAALGHGTARTAGIVWHLEGRVSLRDQHAKKRYYGAQSGGYVLGPNRSRTRPRVRSSLLRQPGRLARHPSQAAGLIVLKAAEASGIILGARDARRCASTAIAPPSNVTAPSATTAPSTTTPPSTTDAHPRVLHLIAALGSHEAMGRSVEVIAAGTPGDHHVVTARFRGRHDAFSTIHEVGGGLGTYLVSRRAAVRAAVATVDPDVIHLHGGPLTPALALLPALRRRPQVLSIYDWPVLPTRAELRRIPLQSLFGAPRLLARLTVSTVLVRPATLRRLVAGRRVIAVLTPDDAVAAALAGDDRLLRASGGATVTDRRARLDQDHPVLVFAGRAESVRGIEVLVDAMALVRRRRPEATLRLLLLERPDLPRILGHVARSGLAAAVTVETEPRPDLTAELAGATVACFPFLVDHATVPPPFTAVQAMAAGLPVVATPVICLRDLVDDDVNGVLVPIGDAVALAEGVLSVLDDPVRWQRLSDGARRTVRQRYDWRFLVDAAGHAYDPHDRGARHFDALGADYEASAFSSAGLEVVSGRETDAVRHGLAALPAGSLVLDVGAGNGRASRVAHDLGHRVVALDLVPAMVRTTLDHHAADVGVVARLGSPLPLVDEAVDAVVALRVLKWVPEWEAAVAELARVLRPGGVAILEITNPRSLAVLGYRGAPVRCISVAELAGCADRAGLDVVATAPGTRLPHRVWASTARPDAAARLARLERAADRAIGTTTCRSIMVRLQRREHG